MPRKPNTTADTFTLIIWWQPPEECDAYLIPNTEIGAEELAVLDNACGNLINLDDMFEEEQRDTTRLSDAFCANPDHLSEENPKGSKWAGRWASCKADLSKPVLANITRVIQTGFAM